MISYCNWLNAFDISDVVNRDPNGIHQGNIFLVRTYRLVKDLMKAGYTGSIARSHKNLSCRLL